MPDFSISDMPWLQRDVNIGRAFTEGAQGGSIVAGNIRAARAQAQELEQRAEMFPIEKERASLMTQQAQFNLDKERYEMQIEHGLLDSFGSAADSQAGGFMEDFRNARTADEKLAVIGKHPEVFINPLTARLGTGMLNIASQQRALESMVEKSELNRMQEKDKAELITQYGAREGDAQSFVTAKRNRAFNLLSDKAKEIGKQLPVGTEAPTDENGNLDWSLANSMLSNAPYKEGAVSSVSSMEKEVNFINRQVESGQLTPDEGIHARRIAMNLEPRESAAAHWFEQAEAKGLLKRRDKLSSDLADLESTLSRYKANNGKDIFGRERNAAQIIEKQTQVDTIKKQLSDVETQIAGFRKASSDASATPATPAPTAPEMIFMKDPKGKLYKVPANRVNEFKQKFNFTEFEG